MEQDNDPTLKQLSLYQDLDLTDESLISIQSHFPRRMSNNIRIQMCKEDKDPYINP